MTSYTNTRDNSTLAGVGFKDGDDLTTANGSRWVYQNEQWHPVTFGGSPAIQSLAVTTNSAQGVGNLDAQGAKAVRAAVRRSPTGIGIEPLGYPLSSGSFTATQNGGGAVTITQIETPDGPGVRIAGSTAGSYINIQATLPAPVHVDTLGMVYQCPAGMNQVSTYFGETGAFANMISRAVTGLGTATNAAGKGSVLSPVLIGAGSYAWTTTGTVTDSTLYTTMQIRVTPTAGNVASIDLSRICINPSARGEVSIVIDDGDLTVYQYALHALAKRQLVCSISAIPDYIGGDGYMTLTQLKQAVDAGHEILTHDSLTANGLTAQQRISRLAANRDALDALGLFQTAEQRETFIYPGGDWQNNIGETDLLDLMRQYGFKRGRVTTRFQCFAPELWRRTKYGPYIAPIIGHMRGTTEANQTAELSSVTGAIADCGTYGLSGSIMLHRFVAEQASWLATDTVDIETNDFATLCDAIVTQRAAGKVQNVLFSEHGLT